MLFIHLQRQRRIVNVHQFLDKRFHKRQHQNASNNRQTAQKADNDGEEIAVFMSLERKFENEFIVLRDFSDILEN